MTRPEGYRKAQRLACWARSSACCVTWSTQAGLSGQDAEEGGQASAIARSIETFVNSWCPPSRCHRRGVWRRAGPGCGDRVLMLETPSIGDLARGCAALVWRDSNEAGRAAAALRVAAHASSSSVLSTGHPRTPEERRPTAGDGQRLMHEIS